MSRPDLHPRRSPQRPTGRFVVGLLLFTLALGVTVLPARPLPAGAQEADDPVATDPTAALELVARSPWVEPDGALTLSVRTTGDVSTANLRVQIHAAVRSVAGLDDALDGDVGRRLYRSPPIPVGFVPTRADGTRELEIATSTTTSDDFTARLPEPGVYPLTLALEAPDGTVLTTIRTPVVRLGTDDDPLDAPRLAVVVDITAAPSIGVDGTHSIGSVDVARLGRLATLLSLPGTEGAPADAAVDRPPLTVAALPDTIDALTASADPRAAEILDVLTTIDDGRLALGLPYVDVSAQALVDADLDGFLPGLAWLGRNVLTARLAADVTSTYWAPHDGLGTDGAAVLAALDVRHLLVDSSELAATSDAPESDDRLLLDAGPRPLRDLAPLDAVLIDRSTSDALVAAAPDTADAPHRALAELLLRTPPTPPIERAGDDTTRNATTVVVQVDDLPDDAVLRGLLPLLATAGSPITLGGLELIASGPEIDAPDLAWPPTGPDAIPPPTDLTDIASRVRATNDLVDTFSSIVDGEAERLIDHRLRVATAMAEGLTAAERIALLDATTAAVDGTFAAVALSGPTDLNLTSRSGTLPLVLRNDAGFPVRVVVEIRSERLGFPDGSRFEVLLDEEITRLDVPVEARATGSVPTFVTVTTPDGEVGLDSRQLNVRSTAISGVGLFLSLGALAVLILWWGRSWLAGRRAAAAA